MDKILEEKLAPLVIRNWVSHEWCSGVRALLDDASSKYRSYQGRLDLNEREAKVQFLDEGFRKPFCDFENTVIEGTFGYRVDRNRRGKIALYRYPTGVGFIAHHDMVTEVERKRCEKEGLPIVDGDYTVIIMLSAPCEYDGGELWFVEHGVSIKPPIGSIIAFPAIEAMKHSVTPISRGSRVSVVCRTNFLR